MRRLFWLGCLALITATSPARAQERLNVVASFSILGDFVRNVGGDRVSVTTLVGPDGDAHVYTPTAADAKRIADARLVIVNGLGFEGWLSRLVQSSGRKPTIVTATGGITPRKLGSEADPHAWQSVANAKIYVANIRDALAAADASGSETYRANAESYLAKLDALDREMQTAVAQIPQDRRKVISTHDAFEATKICSRGRMPGSSSSDPIGTIAMSRVRSTFGSAEPQVRQNTWVKNCAVGNWNDTRRSAPLVKRTPSTGAMRFVAYAAERALRQRLQWQWRAHLGGASIT